MIGLGFIGVAPAGAVSFGTNLIVNGDAEAVDSDGDPTEDPWVNVVGLVRIGEYDDADGLFPTSTDPGSANHGSRLFAGLTTYTYFSVPGIINQTIDLSMDASVIDTGNISYDLSGWFGGIPNLYGFSQLSINFLDENSSGLDFRSLAVDVSDLAVTGLLDRNTSGSIPIGTRSITVELLMTSSNYAYADNLSLVLTNNAATSVPEPSVVPGLLIGGAVVVSVLKKRKRKL
jgi:hypothetical protein